MPRRGENIYKRKDGRYEGRYIIGRREDGSTRFGYIYAYTYSEVKTALTIAKAENRDRGETLVIGNGTVAEFLNYWLENCVRGRVKPSTYTRYFERVGSHIIPEIGDISLRKMTAQQAQSFADKLLEKGLAPSTADGILSVLRSALKKARELGAAAENHFERVTLPEYTVKKAQALDRRQQLNLEQLAQRAEKSTELAVFLSLYSGLRIGELCALRWRDVDLECGTVTVRGTMQRIKNLAGGTKKTAIVEMAPKSKTSCRTIPLQAGIVELLLRSRDGADEDGYVLSCGERRIEPRVLRSQFTKLIRRAGLDITFHTLRHTFATRCLEHNFDVQTLSELLGHSNATVTMKVYAHSMLEHKRSLVERMQILS